METDKFQGGNDCISAPQADAAFYEGILHSLIQPVLVINPTDFSVVWANDAARKGAWQSGVKCYSLQHDRDTPCCEPDHPCPLKQVQLTGQPVNVQHNHYDTRGNAIPVDVHAKPVFDDRGQIRYIVETIRDISERRHIETDLDWERNRAQQYLDVAGVILLAIHSDQQVALINKKGCEVLGYDEADILNTNWFERFVPERKRPQVQAVFDQLMAGKLDPIEYYENPIVTKDGRERLIAWHSNILKNEAGHIVGTLSSGEDITERKQAEQELLLKTHVFECSIVAKSIADDQGIIRYVNPAFVSMWAYDHEDEVIGRSIASFFQNEEDATPILASLHQTDMWEGTFLACKKDGSTFISQGLATVIRDEKGELIGYQSSNQDVTEQKEAVKALRRSEQSYAQQLAEMDQIYKTSPVGLCFVDTDLHHVRVNQALAEINGFSVEAHIGKRIRDILPEIGSEIESLFHRIMESRQPLLDYEIHGTTPAAPGVERDWLVNYYPVTSEDGRVLGVGGVVQEITDRKRAEEALRRSEWSLARAQKLAHVGSWFWDVASGAVEWSDEVYRIFDLDPDTFHPQIDSVMSRFHPEDRLMHEEVLRQAIDKREQYSFEARILHPDGMQRYIFSTSEGRFDAKGSLIQVSGIVQDITERKQTVEELERHQQHLEDLVEERTWQLDQRVKELNCLFDMAKLVEVPDISLDDIIQGTVELIPTSWQQQRQTSARIWLKGKEYKAKGFRKTSWKRSCDIVVHGAPAGCLELYSWQADPLGGETAASAESWKLIEIVTERLGRIIERKHAEEMMDLARFPSENPNPVLRVARDGEILYSNKAGEQLLDKWGTRIGYKVPDLWCKRIEDNFQTLHGPALDTEEILERKVYSLTIAPVREAGYANIYGSDITERKRAVAEIEKLAKFPAENPNPVLRVSEEGVVLYANGSGSVLLASWKCNVGDTLPEDQGRIVKQVLNSNQVYEQEVNCGALTLALSFAPVPEARFVNIYGLDVSERVRVRQALMESEQRFARQLMELNHIYDMSPVGLCFMDTDLRFVRINEALAEINGKPAADHIGKTLWEILPDLAPDLEPLYRNVVSSGEPILNMEMHAATPALPEVERDWLISYYPIKSGDGSILGVGSVVQEITERKRAAEAVLEAQRRLVEQQKNETERVAAELAKVQDELIRKTQLAAIGQVSGSIAHDLRNPLGSVRNANYLLKRRLPKDNTRITEPLRVIDEEIARADTIISNLLSIARRRPPERQQIDLGLLLEETFSEKKMRAGIAIRLELSPSPFLIHGDPDQLRQVFANLHSNACHAMGGGGVLEIKAHHERGEDVIVFLDNGSGIPDKVRDKLFEPLVTTKAKGTGLGLTICQQIIEAHRGSISAEDRDGPGTCICIRLHRRETEQNSTTGGSHD